MIEPVNKTVATFTNPFKKAIRIIIFFFSTKLS